MVSFQDVRPMKPLLASVLVLLTAAVYADQYAAPPLWYSDVRYSDVPISEIITIREMPSYSVSNGIVTTVSGIGSYTAAKPPEMPPASPQPLSLIPVLPMRNLPQAEAEPAAAGIVRGQGGEMGLAAAMDTPPPFARGPIEDALDPKIVGAPPDSGQDDPMGAGEPMPGSANSAKSSAQRQTPGIQSADPLGYGMLVLVTIVTTIGLICMAFAAYEYHQRWVQSVTMHNDRCIGSTFDMETEDSYGSSLPFSDGLGLPHRPA